MQSDIKNRILIVDDDISIHRLVKAAMGREYLIEGALDGEEALAKIATFAPGVVLLDLSMPGIDGYETCRRLKAAPAGAGIQVIVVTGKSSRQEQVRAYEVGADDYVTKPFNPHELLPRVRLHFQLRDTMGRAAEIRTEIEQQNREIKRLADQRAQEIIALQDVAVFTLAKVAESRDQETGDHLLRMRAYSQLLADELGRTGPYVDQIDQTFLDDLFRSSPLHDIGKVGIRDDILLKRGRLTPEEFATMQEHTIIGANILDQAVLHSQGGGFLAMAALIARFHHEHFDGSGYPAGLVGEEIPLPARIVAVADVYDALTSARPYKPAYTPEHSKQIIECDSGRHFDPVVVAAFRSKFDDFLRVNPEEMAAFPVARGAMSFREFDFSTLQTLGTGALT
jgi:response regulator RpfG family c-di-GMP phosphodiesterase